MIYWTSFFLIFTFSLSICAILVLARHHYIPLLAARDDLSARQALHKEVTPRLGGLGIMLSAALAMLLLPLPQSQTYLFTVFALSLMPVVVTGLAEDLGYRISPRGRLIAAAGSSLLMIVLLNVWIGPNVGIAALDTVLQVGLLAIPITVLWATGVCHGFNLIDGVNGLSSGIGVMIAAGLWWVARDSGQSDIALISFAMIAAILGFLVFNWPYGRIFLGDAGAYGIGHVLTWLAVLIAWNAPQPVSAALALMFFWPIADTLLAIWRRYRKRLPVTAPDRLHFHQCVYRLLAQIGRGRLSGRALNSLTGLVLMPFAGAPVLVAILLKDLPYMILLAWICFSVLFVLSYDVGIRVFRSRRLRPDFVYV